MPKLSAFENHDDSMHFKLETLFCQLSSMNQVMYVVDVEASTVAGGMGFPQETYA